MERDSLPKSELHGGFFSRLLDLLSFVAVSGYLGLVLLFLLLSGRLRPGFSIRTALGAVVTRMLRRREPLSRRRLGTVHREQGHCSVAKLPRGLVSDQEGRSRLKVYEDGRPLGPAHALHETVRLHGAGAFSHWGGSLYFSSSDNRDPATSNRVYEISEEE